MDQHGTLRFVEGEENLVAAVGELSVVVADTFTFSGEFFFRLAEDAALGSILKWLLKM